MARQVASLFGVLRLDDSDYKNKIASATQDTNSLGQTLQNRGQQLQQFGQGMTAFFAPVGAAMGYALVQGHSFDRTFSNINAILQLGTDEAAALRRQILAYGSNTVAGPQATAEAYYEIVSGVADASTHMAILEAATRTAEAGQADLGATTSAMIAIMNSYGFAAGDAALVSDVLSRTVGMGVGSMDQFAAAFPAVTGLAAQYNVSLESLGGAMAYLTTQGNTASVSSTYLRSMITTLLNPTADLAEVINSLGYESGAALLEAEGLFGAYAAISEVNGGFAGLITNTEALAGATALVNEEGGAFLYTYTQGLEGATDAAGAIQDQTESWALLRSQLDGVAIQLSTALMPTLTDLVTNYISPAVTAVSGWISENPELTTQIMLLTGGLVILGPIIAGVGSSISVLGSLITFMTGPLGLLIAGVGLLAAAYYTNFGGIKDYIDTNIFPLFQTFIDWGGRLWTDIQPQLANLYNWFVVDALPGVLGYLNDHIFPLFTNFAGLISDLWTFSQPHLQSFYNWFMVSGLPPIKNFIDGPLTSAFNTISGVVTGFIGGVNDAITAARSFMGVSSGSNLVPVEGGRVISAGSMPPQNADGSGYVRGGMPVEWQEPKSGGEIFIPRVTGSILNAQQQFASGLMSAMGLNSGGGNSGGDTYTVTVYANSYEEGQAAERGFDDAVQERRRGRGITVNHG